MFQSATVKLTGWYLLILMSISILFSIIIYQVASSEINTRLESLQQGLQRQSVIYAPSQFDFRTLRNYQTHEAEVNLFVGLFYANVLVLGAGGVGSYLLARRTLEPIERAHIAQSRFTSDASHELRTPLAVMKTELEVALRDANLSKADMRELLSSNLEEVDKLTRLSHTLLQLSRLDHSGIKKTRVNLDKVVTETIERFDKTGERIRFTPHAKPLFVDAHLGSVEELMTILIDNALKYSPAGSPVTVVLGKQNKKASVEITNGGKGIKPEDLPHIFDRFYRADTSRTSGAQSGYGLGLSLAKKIVELHHGELSATSAPNHETKFVVSLPIFSKHKAENQ